MSFLENSSKYAVQKQYSISGTKFYYTQIILPLSFKYFTIQIFPHINVCDGWFRQILLNSGKVSKGE